MTKRFYEVVAKCGHVGKSRFYRGYFYECAFNKEEAAAIVRGRGRVKHHHKDAILSVREISQEEYLSGVERKSQERYFLCRNRREQAMYMEEIEEHLVAEERHDRRWWEQVCRDRKWNDGGKCNGRRERRSKFNWRNLENII